MTSRRVLAVLAALLAPWAADAAITVDAHEITTFTGNDSSYAVNIPGDACTSAQQLVIVAGSSTIGMTLTWPAGYTQFADSNVGGGGSERLYAAYHNCDGSEGTTFTVTPSVAGRAIFRVLKISGDDGAEPSNITSDAGNDAAPNPLTLTPAGGSQDYLWIIGTVWDNSATVTLSSCPTNYTTNCASDVSGTANAIHLGLGVSWRTATASSENPATFTLSATETWDTITIAVAPASGSPPAFSANPSCSATTDGVSCTYTADAASTVYGVGVNPGDGTPTCTQIKAGQNDGGAAALWTGSDANTGTADTVVVTGASKPVRMDLHFCLNNASGNSAVYSGQTDKDRSARAGFATVVMASHSSTGLCNLDAYFDPDCADGDIIEYEDDTNEDADCNVTVEADGDLLLTPVAAGDCDGKRTFNLSYQDVSSATTGLFTAPTVGTFAVDDTICVNNSAPVAGEALGAPLMWALNSAITSIDLTAFFTDADADTLTFTLTTGTWPTGVAQSGTGGKDVTGTPTVENEAGVALVVTATDDCGDSATYEFYGDAVAEDVYVVNTWTMPNCVGVDVGTCADLVTTSAPWRIDPGVGISGFVCVAAASSGDVTTQSPTAASQASPFQLVEVEIGRSCASLKYRRLGLGVGR